MKYRVLLMCKDCDKVYNGTRPIEYSRAMKIYLSTLMNNKDKCKKCEEDLLPVLEEFNK